MRCAVDSRGVCDDCKGNRVKADPSEGNVLEKSVRRNYVSPSVKLWRTTGDVTHFKTGP